ncbi:MurR/RpiR family transcriptional regulator [Vibrio sp. VB16]|jgi:RpiR family carbohydrate utilization transcriptional regulator|uniref:MurR/RpiR family transcriptional regulator n=1 Tax=Vibrio sp. VB16 TaxID=2785746 RepID=UPI00189F8CD5|nr:MurR/RpiR family transcriptional regulator [Vibrio sp. VB16]UGA53900.1 MurR/RpiR family transcriptional regulator [Vibrio sp. VB16]
MTYEIDIVSRIHDAFVQLRDAEKRVAKAITENITFCANASITEIAKKAGVSEASVTRFAKAIGCKDVRELKIKLAQCQSLGQRFVTNTVYSDTQGLFLAIHKTLDRHEQMVSEKMIEKAIGYIEKSKQLVIFGSGGSSSVMAQEAQNRLFRLGITCSALSDSMMGRMTASVMQTDDVLMVFSISGRTPELLEITKIAKQYGSKIIAFTSAISPLAQLADVTFKIEISEGDDIFRPTTSRYALMVQLDVLSMKLAHKREKIVQENLRKIKLNLDAHRGGSGRLPLGD